MISPFFMNSRIFRDAKTLAPLEIPAKTPSSFHNRLVVMMASSSLTWMISSASSTSITLGMKPSPIRRSSIQNKQLFVKEKEESFRGRFSNLFNQFGGTRRLHLGILGFCLNLDGKYFHTFDPFMRMPPDGFAWASGCLVRLPACCEFPVESPFTLSGADDIGVILNLLPN